MNRLAIGLIVLLLGAVGFAWYQKTAQFHEREAALVEARSELEEKVRVLEEERDTMRAEIETLSQRLEGSRLSVGELPRKTGLEQRLRKSYSQLADADWGVIEVFDEKSERYVEYMVVPLWMSETFIIDHQNARLYSQCLANR